MNAIEPRDLAWAVLTLPLALASFAPSARAEKSDWAEGSDDASDGATRDFYNRAGLLRWQNHLGDWRDAGGTPQGDRPYATAVVADDDRTKPVEWDVTALAREWQSGAYRNQGLLLRAVAGGGTIVFSSREHSREEQRPRLLLDFAGGEDGPLSLLLEADTFLDASTYRSLGQRDSLRVSGRPHHALLRFALDGKAAGPVARATLRLHTTAQYGAATIGVFRCAQGHDRPPAEPKRGLAARYPGDRGIQEDPDVILFAGFEEASWDEAWSHVAERRVIDTVDADAARSFSALRGKALRVKIAEGANAALNTSYRFRDETGSEPEEIYFRYYLRLADDWNQTRSGGKMPGISGTYGVAGWGGRKTGGRDGWSARGSFHPTIPEGNPLAGLHPLGTYCYHADMRGRYGDTWLWDRGYRGFLEKNRWYSIEQHLRLNTPGRKDGVIRAWVDGRLAFERRDIRFRHVDELKIEKIWMNVYHGGTATSPHDQHLYIDHVVIARGYIGPMAAK